LTTIFRRNALKGVYAHWGSTQEKKRSLSVIQREGGAQDAGYETAAAVTPSLFQGKEYH